MPLFSIIIPIYNSENYLAQCLESVISQSEGDFECILINDGSNDSSADIISRFCDKDKRFISFYKQNGGYTSAMNLGIDKSSGDYLIVLGSDDRLNTELLKSLKDEIMNTKPDIISFRAVKKHEKGDTIDRFSNFQTYLFTKEIDIPKLELKYEKHVEILFHRDTCKCFKKSRVGKIRYVGKTGFDSDGIFSIEVLSKCKSASWIPFDGYYWSIRGDSISGSKPKLKTMTDRLNVWIYFFNKLFEGEIKLEMSKSLDQLCVYVNEILKGYILIALKDGNYDKPLFHKTLGLLKTAEKKYSIKIKLKDKIFRLSPVLFAKLYSIQH